MLQCDKGEDDILVNKTGSESPMADLLFDSVGLALLKKK